MPPTAKNTVPCPSGSIADFAAATAVIALAETPTAWPSAADLILSETPRQSTDPAALAAKTVLSDSAGRLRKVQRHWPSQYRVPVGRGSARLCTNVSRETIFPYFSRGGSPILFLRPDPADAVSPGGKRSSAWPGSALTCPVTETAIRGFLPTDTCPRGTSMRSGCPCFKAFRPKTKSIRTAIYRKAGGRPRFRICPSFPPKFISLVHKPQAALSMMKTVASPPARFRREP